MCENRYKPIYNNGVYPDVTDAEIERELTWYRDNGYGGFAVNGTCREKLKDVRDWLPGYLDACRRYAECAKRLGLDMWLFDEWGYPSGCACGLVLTDELRAKKLHVFFDRVLEAGEEARFKAPDRLLAVGAIPVNRFYPYHPAGRAARVPCEGGEIVYRATEKTRLVAVTWEYLSFVTHVMKDYEEGDPTIGTVDILDQNAVRKFLDNMHERYIPYLGGEFGKTVKGFFYDEPEICWDFPYTPALDARYEQMFHRPLADTLPELLAYLRGECGVTGGGDAYPYLKRAFDDYTAAWTGLLADAFYGQIETWCHAHNLLSVGHQDLDNRPETFVSVSGDFYQNSARNDMPGIDVIFNNIEPDRFDDFPRFAGSVKRALGKQGAMSETFAEMGNCIYPDLMRFDMEHQILRGVDQFFLYTFHNAKPQRDPNVGLYTRQIMERAERTARMMNEGESACDIALLMPLRDIAFERADNNPHLVNGYPLSWQRVEILARALCYAPVDFDYAWEEKLDGLWARGFRTVILPGGSLTEAAERALRDFAKRGGRLISAIQPTHQLLDVCPHIASVRQLIAALPRAVELHAEEKAISLCERRVDGARVFMLLNEANAAVDASLTFPEGSLQEMDARTGAWRALGTNKIETRFAARESKFYRINGAPALPARIVRETVPLAPFAPALGTWPDPAYSGFAPYKASFDWPGGEMRLRLGDVRFAARVTIGENTYDLPFAPYELNCDLPKGQYDLTVEVMNSEANRDFAEREGYAMRYPYEQAYLQSGLFGPVTLERMENA